MPLLIKFISTNIGKIREITELLSDMINNKEIILEIVNKSITEIQGTADEVIRDKILRASQGIPGIVMIEDTSLFYEALNMLPGPYIKDFQLNLGKKGLVKILEPFDNKNARVECRIALKFPGEDPEVFIGVLKGTIVSPKGKNDFFWDSIFQPLNHSLTYAETLPNTKNQISDRKQAVQFLKSYLRSRISPKL